METSSSLAVIAVIIFALLAGFAIPVLLQARTTLRHMQRFLDSTSTKLDAALADLTQLTGRLNRVADEVERTLPRIQRVLDVADGAADVVTRARNSLNAATAVVPAAIAALKAAVSSLLTPRDGTRPSEPAAEAVLDWEGAPPRAAS